MWNCICGKKFNDNRELCPQCGRDGCASNGEEIAQRKADDVHDQIQTAAARVDAMGVQPKYA